MNKTLSLLSALLLTFFYSSAQDLNSAWQSFFKNDTEQATKAFKELANKPETAENAYLGLSLISDLTYSSADALDYFKKFYGLSKNQEPYIFALWKSPSIHDQPSKVGPANFALINEIAVNKNFDGAIHAMAYGSMGSKYESSKKIAEADKAYAQIGSIDNWQITSRFENISTSGFDKTYDVLDKPQADAVFSGKRNLKFGWRKVPATKHSKWFDFTFYDDPYQAIMFAQTFVNAPAEIKGQLRIGVSGSVKVWVNDQLLISEAEERNNDLDAYISTVKLNAGYNRILVQVGESYAGSSNFLLRITDEKGQPISNLTNVDEYQPYQKETAFKPARLDARAYEFFRTAIKKDSSDVLSQVLMAKMYLRDDIIFEARNILEQLRSKFPESTYLNAMMIELHAKEENRTGITTAQEQIKTADPEGALGLDLLFEEYYSQDNFDKAEEVLQRIEKRFGQTENVTAKQIKIASKRNNQDKVIELAEKAYKQWPDNNTFMYLKYVIENEVKKNAQALNVVKKYVTENDAYNYSKFLSGIYLDKADVNNAVNIYLQEIKNDPIATGIYNDLANVYYKIQKYDKAEEYMLKTIKLSPYISSYYHTLGLIYEAKKDKAKADENYKKSLSINPNNYAALEQLRKLNNKKDVFEYFEQPDISQLIKNAPGLKEYPDDHSVILNEEVQAVVYENGGSEEKHFYTTKVLTQKGLEGLKEYDIAYNGDQTLIVEVAEVIKPSGVKTPAEQNNNNMVFTNLEVGDIINIRYKLQNYNIGSLAAHFWSSFYFTHGNSYVNTKYSLLINKDKKFSYKFSENPIEVQKISIDEFDKYVWHAKNQIALRYEDKMPPQDDVTNILYVSTIPDWKFVADWYNNIAAAKARSSYEVKSVTNQLFGSKNGDDLQKIKTIYKYITQNIAYSSVSFRQSGIIPQNPATVLNTRIGDCKDVSTLFVTMCKEVGVNAELVLAKTRDNGQNTLLLPSIDFNHCIAKANINGQDYYLELTSNSLPFGTFYNSDLSSPILNINKATSTLTKLNPTNRSVNAMSYQTAIKINDNNMEITESNFDTGAAVSFLINDYNNLSLKDQIKKMKEQLSSQYPENDVADLSFTNLDPKSALSDTIAAKSTYTLKNVCKPVAGMSIFALPWSAAIYPAGLTITEPRNFGIDLTQLFYTDKTNEEIALELPTGKKLIEPVKPLTIDNEYFKYALSSKSLNNKVIINRTFILKKDFVAKDKVQEFHSLYKKLAESDQQQLAFK
ncbi:transglutaminase domain-containing protein [Pedobacter sandarakinus]|uniref:transglutaminase domain-containing protein n=1 Tax=Pedobacter sandarakinus TaxID=353156 RepID=UPI00224703B2|nr:DUF3857 domain-containing protein [Pedobacter sandarakinus]MCX2575296.1 DUF3857 domain-containing protein [Pedobacter sandarakinus]